MREHLSIRIEEILKSRPLGTWWKKNLCLAENPSEYLCKPLWVHGEVSLQLQTKADWQVLSPGSCRGDAGLSCSGKHPGCNIPSAGHRGSSAGRKWDHSCRARVLHPCRGCCAVPSGQAGERGDLTVLRRGLARLRPDIGLTFPMGWGSQSPLFSPLQPTLPHG